MEISKPTYARNVLRRASVLLTDSRYRLKELIKVCGNEEDALGLKFSSGKLGVMVYNVEKGDPLEI